MLSTLVLLASTLFAVSAAPIPQRAAAPVVVARSLYTPPAGWASEWLESYDVYHGRYKALDCRSQHDTTFFDDCCHPLLATESLSSRPAYCTPSEANSASAAVAVSSIAATASAPAVTSSVDAIPSGAATLAASAIPAAQSSLAATIDDDLEYCDEEEEESSSAAPAPTATAVATSAAAAATTTVAAAPAATSAAAAAASDVKTGGFATYFMQNGNAGACGTANPDSLPLVAITYKYWGGDAGAGSSMCGKTVDIKRVSDGRTVSAIVADLCPTCTNDNSLDLSVGAFTQLATEAEGMVGITWSVRD